MTRPAVPTSLALLAILACAALLRFGDLNLIEFKGDEAVAVELARPLAEGRSLPRVGMMSSVGIHNPPLFVWLTALPLWAHHDPRFVTAALTGLLSLLSIALTFRLVRRRFSEATALITCALYATATWPVIYARKIWAQDVLPLFSTLLLGALWLVWERPKTRWVAAVPVLCSLLWQLHFSAFAVILVCAGLLAARARSLHWGWLAGGVAVGLLLMGPWLSHQAEHDWEDLKGLGHIASGRRADGSAREAPKAWTAEPLQWAAYASSGTRLGYALGSSEEARAAPALAGWVGTFGHALLGAGTLWLVVLAFRGRRGPEVVAAGWLVGYVLIYLLVRLEHLYPHYFILLYPAPFLAMACPLGAWARTGRRAAWGAGLVTALVVAGHLSNLAAGRALLRRQGGASGDYGVIYEHKAALTDWIVAHGLDLAAAPGFEYRHLVDTARRYGDPQAAAERSAAREAPPAGWNRVRVHDSLRAPSFAGHRCLGRQDFGPLVACPAR